MKKLILAASLIAASFNAFSQEYKPVAGDVTAEIGLLGGISFTDVELPSNSFGTPNMKFRYFLADQMAVRVGFNYTSTSEKNKIYEVAPGTGEGSAVIKNSIFALNLGLEKHLAGTERLSTYVGGDLTLQINGASEKGENTNNGTTFTNGDSYKLKGFNNSGDNGGFGLGLRGVVGAEYYFVEKVYLGAEFGWGFTTFSEAKTKSETTTGGTSTTVETKSTGGDFSILPTMTAGVRLGFRF
jgi:hypothetical protein